VPRQICATAAARDRRIFFGHSAKRSQMTFQLNDHLSKEFTVKQLFGQTTFWSNFKKIVVKWPFLNIKF
jgi:hypothetical protein